MSDDRESSAVEPMVLAALVRWTPLSVSSARLGWPGSVPEDPLPDGMWDSMEFVSVSIGTAPRLLAHLPGTNEWYVWDGAQSSWESLHLRPVPWQR